MKRTRIAAWVVGSLVLLAGFFCHAPAAFAQETFKAYDVASNYSNSPKTWTNNANLGYGFGPWTIAMGGGGTTGQDLGNPGDRHILGMLNPSFRFWAHTAVGCYINIDRSFAEPMAVGDVFSFKWAFNYDSGSPGSGQTGIKGFRIMDANGTRLVSATNGNSAAIAVNGVDAGFAYGTNAMTWACTYESETNLLVHATGRVATEEFTANIPISSAPDGFRLYASQMQGGSSPNMRYPYFNEFKIESQTKLGQEITFAGGAWQTKVNGDAPFTLSASASSGLPVTFSSSKPAVASVSGNTVTIHKAGWAKLTATQAGDDDYQAAAPVTLELEVKGGAGDFKAYDIASDYGGEVWAHGSNEGYGFKAWDIAKGGGDVIGHDLGDPGLRGLTGMLSPAFRMWAHTGTGTYVNAEREFAEPMAMGEALSFKWAYNFDSGSPASGIEGIKGFRVLDASGNRLVSATNAASATIGVNGMDTAFTYGTNAMIWTITMESATNLLVHATGRAEAEEFSASIPITGAPAKICLFVSQMQSGAEGTGANMRYPYFNEFKIEEVVAQEQTITFATGAWQTKTYGDAPFELVASSDSGLPVSFESSDTSVATVSGSTVTILKAGTTTLTASQAGDLYYNAAESVERLLTVNKANPSVSAWPTATPITLGQTLADSTLVGGTATPAGSFAWTNPSEEPTEIGTLPYGVTFTPTDTVNYHTVQHDINLTVNEFVKQDPEVTAWPVAGAITYGQSLSNSVLSGGIADVDGLFEWSDDTVTPAVGAPAQNVTFIPDDEETYNRVYSTVAIMVHKATPSVTEWPEAGAITYGQSLADSTLSGGAATVVGAFTWTDDTVVPDIGQSDQEVTFTPTDTGNYTTAANDVSVTVGKATPSITTPPTAGRIFVGDTLAESALAGGAASVDGSFAWTDDTVEPARGTANQPVTFTPADTTRYNTVALSVSVTVWADAITFFVKPADWWEGGSEKGPEMFGPFVGGSWTGHDLVWDGELGWWTLTVEVDDAAAPITHQLRLIRTTSTKYQKATGDFGANPVFTTTTGEIWIDASGDYVWESGTDNFYLAEGATTEDASKNGQTITFEEGDWQSKVLGDPPFELVAAASSGLPVSFESLNMSVATVSGSTVTIVGAGEAVIRATQAGDDDYSAAQPVERTLTVGEPPTGTEFFTAGTEAGGDVVVRWRMKSEYNLQGFWIERYDNGDWIRLNSTMIPAAGGVYGWLDGDAEDGGTYFYRVVSVLNDNTEREGGAQGRVPGKLEFTDPVGEAETGITIRWTGRVEETYKVMRTTDLTQDLATFAVLEAGIAADESGNEFTDEDPPADRAFYLIQVDFD